MGNQNSAISKAHDQAAKVASTEPQYVPRQRQGKPSRKAEDAVRLGVYSEEHGKKSLDNDGTFTEYIHRAKQKLRTMSSIGHRRPEQSNSAPADVANGTTNNKEDHKDQFSDFIQHAKKKLRTTSRIGKSSSFKRG